MKILTKKITAIILAFQVLLITTSFTVDYHYCSENIVDMSILGKAKNCEEIKQMSMEGCNMEVSSCDNENCCYDEKLLRVGSEEIKQVINKFDLESITFLNTFFYSYNCLFEGLEENIVPFKNYVTPLIIKDISVLFETFLI